MGTEYSEYEVVVGNVGMVHSGGNKRKRERYSTNTRRFPNQDLEGLEGSL